MTQTLDKFIIHKQPEPTYPDFYDFIEYQKFLAMKDEDEIQCWLGDHADCGNCNFGDYPTPHEECDKCFCFDQWRLKPGEKLRNDLTE